jgi:anthranilate synthase component 1
MGEGIFYFIRLNGVCMFYPTLEEIKKHRGEGNIIPIFQEITADLETPISAFLKINRGKFSFLLESVEGGQKLARYSFIGTEPYKVISTTTGDKTDPLNTIAEELKKYKIIQIGELPRFCGGAIGYLAYEVASHFEDLPSPQKDPLDLPESLFMLVKTMLVFDHVTHKIKVISFVNLDEDIDTSYREAVAKIEDMIHRLNQPLPQWQFSAITPPVYKPALASNFSKEEFLRAVIKIKDYIAAGEAIQVVLSQRMTVGTNASSFEIYRELRSLNPSPYMFFLDCGEFQIIGASPEILVRVEGDMVTSRPLAGTRPRSQDHDEDIRLEQELLNDEKERAEHIMLVDLARNDVGRVSEPGTVRVSELMSVERYSYVMHLVTNVQGKLKYPMSMYDTLRACFPAGTVTGAPKIRAMQIIAELEPEKRGPYAGAIGYLSFTGNMDMAIAIRTMVVKKGVAYIQAGCGIVHDSQPELEYVETTNKAQALLKSIFQADINHKNAGDSSVITNR